VSGTTRYPPPGTCFCPCWQLEAMPFLTQASAWHLPAYATIMGARTRTGWM